ncbi:MAG TPA: class I SAM-dependent methyltransferase [Saprospiraceae bacterium]|nr:class I SAM-dependent methyltransferase [Saprospiraceae bacterium]
MKGFSQLNFNYKELEFYFPRKKILAFLKFNIKEIEGKLLDVGCGKKPYKSFILKNNNHLEYIGLDIKNAINYGGEKPDIYWEDGKIPLLDNSIKIAIATEVLEHVQNPNDLLSEIKRVLMPGGILLITIPFIWPFHEIPNDHYRYTPFAIKNLLENTKFRNIKINAMGGWNASLGQMLALWAKRNFKSKVLKLLFSFCLYPVIWALFRFDKLPQIFKEGNMVTGLGIIANK